ncbi:hypothetical protein A1Q2_08195 [Trichosporon asahii var. asahii CBS 8904]|uniref:BHLH domain-containing protein n=1 Tax=Trichosporon asahii var. asahii (strain CBS 8904) TaxID=1220162 RepID=K1W6P2_TRIAC|nr:hypothetical protein A1Q2_08195 [Trichosporon asahii var. asahii CBS 8904]
MIRAFPFISPTNCPTFSHPDERLLTRTGMKDYLHNSPGSSSPSNMSGSGQLPGEEEEKPDISGAQAINQPKAKTDPTQTPMQTPLQTPPDRVGLQDPIDLVSHVNRHSAQGHGTGVSQHSPQLPPQDPQTLGMGFQYGGPPYLYDQSLGESERPEHSDTRATMALPGCRAAPRPPRLFVARELTSPVNYGSGHAGGVALQSHQSHHNGTMPDTPNGGVKYHTMVSGTAVPSSAFMHSIAGQGVQGVPTTMMPGTLHTPISPVGALTAQLNDLSPGHANWLYNQAVHGSHGISPPHSPSENALAFSSGAGAYAGYPFGQPVPHRVQAHMKGARLSIGSSNDEEDADIEPRSGKLVFQPSQHQSQPQPQTQPIQSTRAAPAVPRVSRDLRDANPNVRSDNSDSDHRPSNQPPKEQTSPKEGPRDTRTARIQSEQRRRNELRDGFERLRKALPATFQRCSKTVLLERAVTHIEAEREKFENLTRQHQVLQEQHQLLTALRLAMSQHQHQQQQHAEHNVAAAYATATNGVVNHETLAALNGGHVGDGVQNVAGAHE